MAPNTSPGCTQGTWGLPHPHSHCYPGDVRSLLLLDPTGSSGSPHKAGHRGSCSAAAHPGATPQEQKFACGFALEGGRLPLICLSDLIFSQLSILTAPIHFQI